MSYSDIARNIEGIYRIKLSAGTINSITDKIIPKLKEWQQRPLDRIYPFIWLDAVLYMIKEDGMYKTKAVYATNRC